MAQKCETKTDICGNITISVLPEGVLIALDDRVLGLSGVLSSDSEASSSTANYRVYKNRML